MINKQNSYRIFIFSIMFFHAFLASLGHAEITLDGTLGSTGSLSGPDFVIPAEVGRQVGGNLFHSFGVFNVNAGESATFTGPDSIENIMGRVTGGSSSTIDGLLRSEIPGADLFLINPAGIMFGPNAQLDVQGSFHVSTADFIRLGEDGCFDAVEPGNSLLTVAPPSAFGFLGENPADITVEGKLVAPKNQSLSIVGGNISIIGGTLTTLGGRINLASVDSAGEIEIENIHLNAFERLGDIDLAESSSLLTSGLQGGDIYILSNRFVVENSDLWSYTLGEGKGGNIAINVGSLNLTNESSIGSKSWGAGDGGTVTITAIDNVTFSEKSSISVSASSSGNGGSLSITAPNLDIDNSYITGATYGEGKGGNIAINVGSLNLTNASSINSKSWGAGNGGTVAITASDEITIFENSLVAVSTWLGSSGNGGSLSITTPNLRIDDSWIDGETLGEGKGGNITINVGSLNLTNEADISSEAEDFGNGGTITITASDAVTFSGNSRINVSTEGSGNGGNLSLTTPKFDLNSSWITGETYGEGKGGNITIDVGSLNLTNGADISSDAWDVGNGGTITIDASEAITVSGAESEVSVFTYRIGDGGNISIATPDLDLDGSWIWGTTAGYGESKGGDIEINVGSLTLINGALIASDAFNMGNAGEIAINASDEINMSEKSYVSVSTAPDSSGDGGSILITTSDLDLDNSFVRAVTNGEGKGGDIQLQAKKIELSNGSSISAESVCTGLNISENPEAAKSGTIVIQVDDTLQINNGSSISVETAQANAGDIKIDTGFLVYLRDESAITTSVAGGEGDGGNINIDPVFVVLEEASKVIANALKGSGGNINISIVGDGAFLQSPDSVVDASSEFGVSGSVKIDAPDTDIIGSISTLPVSFLDVSSLLSERCVTRTAGDLSTFIIVGRGGMPLSPDNPLPALYLLDNPKDQQGNSQFNKRKKSLLKNTINKQETMPDGINCCQ